MRMQLDQIQRCPPSPGGQGPGQVAQAPLSLPQASAGPPRGMRALRKKKWRWGSGDHVWVLPRAHGESRSERSRPWALWPLSCAPEKPDAFPQPGGAVSAQEGQACTASDHSPPTCSLKAGPPMIPGVLGVGGAYPQGERVSSGAAQSCPLLGHTPLSENLLLQGQSGHKT